MVLNNGSLLVQTRRVAVMRVIHFLAVLVMVFLATLPNGKFGSHWVALGSVVINLCLSRLIELTDQARILAVPTASWRTVAVIVVLGLLAGVLAAYLNAVLV